MARCIFCPNELTDNTKPEHILPNALGGKKTTRRVICSDCNNMFGSSIDKCLSSQVEIIRNLLQLRSGKGKPPPGLRNIPSGTETVNFRNNGTPELTGKPFTIEGQDDALTTVQIMARSEEEFRYLIPHIAAQCGITVEKLEEQVVSANVFQVSKPLNDVHYRSSFGGIEALRSITKTCLVLWSTVVGNEEVHSSPYNDVRRFVTSADACFNMSRIHLDSRCLPCDNGLRKRFGDNYNLVYLKSDTAGRLIGHFTLYNAVSWQITLTKSGAIPNQAVGLASNPLNPAEWSDTVANEFKIDFDWLDSPAFEGSERAQERFINIAKKHCELSRDQAIYKIVGDVCDKHSILDDDPIPDDLREQVIAEIIAKFAHYILRLPHECSLSPDEIKALLKTPN